MGRTSSFVGVYLSITNHIYAFSNKFVKFSHCLIPIKIISVGKMPYIYVPTVGWIFRIHQTGRLLVSRIAECSAALNGSEKIFLGYDLGDCVMNDKSDFNLDV